MVGLFNILKVTVSEDKICAHVLVNPGMPLMTSEDIEATARVYYLVPAIAKHLCLGDSGREFQDCMGQTELCHLLEHVTVELMNETGLAGSISCGRTRVSEHDERVFEVELSCPDDALAIGALSSATFMMDWAYLHADQPAPDVEGTIAFAPMGENGFGYDPIFMYGNKSFAQVDSETKNTVSHRANALKALLEQLTKQ